MSLPRYVCSLLLTAFLCVSCGQKTEESPVVARVYGYELHRSDLDGIVGEGVSSDDSTAIVNNFIDQWIRQTVLLYKAEKNITDNFDRQLREYRNTLVTYAYEQKIVNQLLDTVVTRNQIADYYNEHQSDFRLQGAIVKATYVALPLKSTHHAKIKQIISRRDFDEQDVVELEETAQRYNLTGYYDINTWMPFITLQRSVPISTVNENIYLRQNRTIELTDGEVTYLVRILDYKVSDEISPLEMQTETIRSIILNHRKLAILSRLQNDLLSEAEKDDNIKRYI